MNATPTTAPQLPGAPAPAPPQTPSTKFDASAPVPEEYDVFCDGCGYSLLGLSGDRCPECGRPFDAGQLPYARVPWLHRRRIGRVAAYRQTVWQVVRRPAAFAEEMCRPVRVSAADARRFRSVTTLLCATALAVSVGLMIYFGSGHWSFGEAAGLCIVMPLGWAAAVWFLRLATDVPVFIWKGLPSAPEELAPLHHYAAAPLAHAPVVALVALGLPALADFVNAPDWFYRLVVTASGLVVGGWLYVCWRTPLALMRGATGCGRRRAALLGAYLPVHVLLMLLLVGLSFVLCMFPLGQLVEFLERHR